MLEPFDFFVLRCGTCSALSVRGGFREGHAVEDPHPTAYPSLFPMGPEIVPPSHTLASTKPVPPEIIHAYRTAWHLRHTAPNAFANQIRRALELICEERGAKGKSLFHKLKDLSSRGTFAVEIADLAHLVRELGNRGSHAKGKDVDIWDAELLDELFKQIVRAVYIAPSHAERMRQRLAV